MEIKTTEQIVHKEMDLSELPNSLLWKDFNKVKWVAVDDVLETIHKIREMKIDAEDMIKELTK